MDHPAKTLRLKLGLTQRAFAESIGISGPYVCQVEGGRDQYGRDTALAISDRYRTEMSRFGITVESLLRGLRDDAA